MKKIIFTLAIAGFSFCGFAQNATPAMPMVKTQEASPVLTETSALSTGISFVENEYNFGKIPQGKPVTHVFIVKNTSSAPYKLENVVASCGCTTPVWDKEKVIAPNATSEITVGYNAAADGVFNKSVTVYFNGTQSKQILIKGEVWQAPAASAPTNENLKILN